MYAVVETGGKQIRVGEGDLVAVEKLPGNPGDEITFDRVLFVGGDGLVVPGNPTVAGATVVGKVLAQARGPKIIVFKYKSKVNYRKKTGHRQAQTRVRITEIRYGRPDRGEASASAGTAAAPVAGEQA